MESWAQGVSVSLNPWPRGCPCARIHTDQEVAGLGLLGNLELSALPSLVPGNRPGSGTWGFVPSPSSHPCSKGPANPNLSTGTVQIPASTVWVLPTPGALQIPNASVLERLKGGGCAHPPEPGWALLNLPGVTGHNCATWRDPLQMLPQPSPSQCEFRSSQS